jgi:hypothetical protein
MGIILVSERGWRMGKEEKFKNIERKNSGN